MTTALLVLLAIHTAMLALGAVMGLLTQRRHANWATGQPLPPEGISVILPIKGLDPGAEEHYRRWLSQTVDRPYEVIFSLQDPQDPVLPLLQALIARQPGAAARILVNPVRPGLNGKSSNLLYGVEGARYPNLVVADSDIVPPLDLLARLVPPLSDPAVGAVSGMPVVRGATNLLGGMNALLLNVAISGFFGTMYTLGMAKSVSGACFAIRREVLDRIGGFAAFGGHFTEDAEMTRRIMSAGYRMVLGPVVTLEQGDSTWPAYFGLCSRSAFMTKHAPTLFDFANMFISLFAPPSILLVGLITADARVVSAALASFAARAVLMGVLQVGSDPGGKWRYAWVYPLCELTLAYALVRALLTSELSWRGIRYRVGKGGYLQRINN